MVLVVAHPDDETLWAGSALSRIADLTVIHATDGAPRDMRDARALGIGERESYAALRAGELDRAFAALDVAPARRGYGIADQELVECLPELVGRLADDLAGAGLVVTHPYEGGHPDHDTLALAVARAVAELRAPPPMVEFACYHEVAGERRFGVFWPDTACPEHVRTLDERDRRRVDAAIAAHASQAAVIGDWRPAVERWRAVPGYDFAAPPPPGRALYDRFGWAMTSARWRSLAAVAERVTA